jgi:phosphatidate cytidylyltransferase
MFDQITHFINSLDASFIRLMTGIFLLLVVASAIGQALYWFKAGGKESDTIKNLNQRVNAWWVMILLLISFYILGEHATFILFGLISFFALREFISITPTKFADFKALSLSFFLIIPLQYYFLAHHWYGMFAIFIPVYAFLILPAISAVSGDVEHFMERTTKIQWGVMATVYCIAHAPALFLLTIPGFEGKSQLLFLYLLIVVQISDVLQYVFGKLFGKHKIAPVVSPSKTVEGFVLGGLAATFVGGSLYWITPFTFWQSVLMSSIIVVMGFLGGLTMSAMKRSIGAKDWGNMIQGHGGMLDRMDSVCFAAPIFFHITRYFFSIT